MQDGGGDFEELWFGGFGVPAKPSLQGGDGAKGQLGRAGTPVAGDRVELTVEQTIHRGMLT